MIRCLAIPSLCALAACTSQPAAITTNLRQAGEPSTVARELTPAERSEAVSAMADSKPAIITTQPLAAAGESGRWREVGVVAVAAAKRCEVAVVRERAIPGGKAFELRGITDQPGEMRVLGDEAHGVSSVTVVMGVFGEQHTLADRLREAFFSELHRAADIPRPR